MGYHILNCLKTEKIAANIKKKKEADDVDFWSLKKQKRRLQAVLEI